MVSCHLIVYVLIILDVNLMDRKGLEAKFENANLLPSDFSGFQPPVPPPFLPADFNAPISLRLEDVPYDIFNPRSSQLASTLQFTPQSANYRRDEHFRSHVRMSDLHMDPQVCFTHLQLLIVE